jgi:hypothetical protein
MYIKARINLQREFIYRNRRKCKIVNPNKKKYPINPLSVKSKLKSIKSKRYLANQLKEGKPLRLELEGKEIRIKKKIAERRQMRLEKQ